MAENRPFLEIDGVSKWFETRRGGEPIHVVDDVSIALDEGDFVVFVGPSGCGKTTLMRIVAGPEQPT